MIHIISSLRNKGKGIPLPVTNISDLQKIPSKDGKMEYIPKKIKAAMSSRCPSVVKILYGAE